MIMMFRIANNLIDVPFGRLFTWSFGSARPHDMKVQTNHFNFRIRKEYFSQRIIRDWNTLPYRVVHAPNVYILKSTLQNNYRFQHLYLLGTNCNFDFDGTYIRLCLSNPILIIIIQPSTKNNTKCG